jgi:hypothetical protein
MKIKKRGKLRNIGIEDITRDNLTNFVNLCIPSHKREGPFVVEGELHESAKVRILF